MKLSKWKQGGWLLLMAITFLSVGCEDETEEKDDVNKRVSNESAHYGGSAAVCEDETFSTLFPAAVIDVPSMNFVRQIHNGLVAFNVQDFSIEPSIAEDWTVSDDGTVYTFKLRPNVTFHDDACFKGGKGRKVVSSDVKYSIELLCSDAYQSNYDILFKGVVVGVDDYFNGTQEDITGIKAVDDHTLEITLTEPSPSFLYKLALPMTSVVPKEGYEKYGENCTIGCGPFKYVKPEDLTKEVSLVYNEKYFGKDENGNSLPYLDSIHFKFISSKIEQLESFDNGSLSLLEGLPVSQLADIVEENLENFSNSPPATFLDIQPQLSTQYYGFITTKAPFNDVKVRKAFNYAIDRNYLVNNVLNGQGKPATHGIVPKISLFNGYDYDQVEGYTYNPELAKQLLAEAGFPNGQGFPNVTLVINLGGNIHKLVASYIEQQINQTLGITISVDQVSFKSKLEQSKYGKSEIYRSAWVADYPLPESFLSNLNGEQVPSSMEEPSYPNTMRYTNQTFDSLYSMALSTTNDMQRNELLAQAESVAMKDSPIMPLWYGENYVMYHSNMRNFKNNALQILDFSKVYIKDLTKEEYEKMNK